MEKNNELKLAVLIDAENISFHYVKGMMQEIAKYGTPTFKRIYADWTNPYLDAWKNVLLENAITPIQQYSYTSGKNSTDSAMIIDAMDILYSEKIDGFCIVSSDSDFTKLAVRLRESGMKVFGFGERKTPNPFIVACDKFIYLEILKNKQYGAYSSSQNASRKVNYEKYSVQEVDEELIDLLSLTVNDVADEDGWAFLGNVGNLLIKKQPDFDARNYGFEKLTPLFKSLTKNFQIYERETDNPSIKHVYIRNK